MLKKEILSRKETFYLLLQIWKKLSGRRKNQFILLVFFNIIASFFESFSIAITLPLISALIDPNQIWQKLWAQNIFYNFGFNSSDEILAPITIIFILASIISTIIKLLILWVNNFYAALIGNDISCEAYSRTLYQRYERHIEMNSSDIISAATSYVDFTVRSIYNSLNFLSYLSIVFAIQVTLFFINLKIALYSILVFSTAYLLISSISKSILIKNGKIITRMTKERIKSLQEGIGSIRDMLLSNKQKIFISQYSKYDYMYRKKIAINKFITFSPRYIIENIGFIFIAILAYSSTNNLESNQNLLSTLGAFAVAAQKLLPAMQQCYNSIGNIRSNKASMFEIIKMLNQKKQNFYFNNLKSIKFKNKIVLSNISFKYISSKNLILKDINLTINKGDRVGIIGKTGSGKSTLADIIMGLLMPSKGNLINDENIISNKGLTKKLLQWRLAISHVPQQIFLSDSTIAENIAFGIERKNIDLDRVKKAAEIAQINTFIDSTKNNYFTEIGENGLKLSGGQRQRLGIARALYRRSQIIIFDEATSALDAKTESEVINALNNLNNDLTLIIVAHRLSTIKKCNRIIKFSDNRIELIKQ